MHGFLGTAASFGSDLNLIAQVLMGVLLVIGALLARAKHFRAHAACMTGVLLLNLVMVLLVMWRPFQEVVLGGMATHFGSRYERIAAIQGVLGLFAEVFGCYILPVAGTNAIPERWRFRRWKLWMRIELLAWWIVLLAGITTYLTWYGPLPHH
jgi:uncharacterized membrane protein YozB (DUF420 family)